MDGYLCIPGGHVEAGESPTAAIIREADEELGLKLAEGDLQLFCVAARYSPKNEYVAYEFMIEASKLNPINNEPDECSELLWVDKNKLPDDIIPDFKDIIVDGFIAKQSFLELGY